MKSEIIKDKEGNIIEIIQKGEIEEYIAFDEAEGDCYED